MAALTQLGDNLAVGFGAALAPVNLLLGIIGVTLGTAVGVLPGIGPAYAAAIVAERERAGPYATTDDLTARGTIPEHVYEGIRDMIAAR